TRCSRSGARPLTPTPSSAARSTRRPCASCSSAAGSTATSPGCGSAPRHVSGSSSARTATASRRLRPVRVAGVAPSCSTPTGRRAMPAAERDVFLEAMLPAQIRAENAIHNGDAAPRLSTWTHHDPVTVFGAGVAFRSGCPEVPAVFDWVAASFACCDDYDFELLGADASGDLAYTVGIERYRASTPSGTSVDNTLRVTHVYRREPDGWRIVHRHGDHMPAEA